MGSNLRLDSTSWNLCALPLEILLHIQHFLPTHGAALFALTNKSIWYKLGNEAMFRLRGEYREITEARSFLLLLERDVPGYYACHECLALHSMDDLPCNSDDLPRTALKLCMKYDIEAEKALFASERIHYQDFRSVMQTRDTTAQKAALRKLKVRTGELIVEFVLQSNKLLMRGQHFIKSNIGSGPAAYTLKLWKIYICNHIKSLGHCGGELGRLVHCNPDKLWSKSLCSKCAAHVSCPLCPTEFESHLVFLNETEYVLVITRWLDLGNCSSPNEPHYRSHMTIGSFRWNNGIPDPLVVCQSGSIKAAFEGICQDQGLSLFKNAANQFVNDLTSKMKAPNHQLNDDLSWFKLKIN